MTSLCFIASGKNLHGVYSFCSRNMELIQVVIWALAHFSQKEDKKKMPEELKKNRKVPRGGRIQDDCFSTSPGCDAAQSGNWALLFSSLSKRAALSACCPAARLAFWPPAGIVTDQMAIVRNRNEHQRRQSDKWSSADNNYKVIIWKKTVIYQRFSEIWKVNK